MFVLLQHFWGYVVLGQGKLFCLKVLGKKVNVIDKWLIYQNKHIHVEEHIIVKS